MPSAKCKCLLPSVAWVRDRPARPASNKRMQFTRHINLTADALRRWFVAQCYDALAVGALWWVGLWYLQVPFAPFWAILAAGLQFIPHFGPVIAFVGPAVSALISDGFEGFLYVLILYGLVIVIDGLLLQPVIMRRTARVPIWASLIVPILLSLIFGFWGWLLAAPLLAVIFAYRAYAKSRTQPPSPVRRRLARSLPAAS